MLPLWTESQRAPGKALYNSTMRVAERPLSRCRQREVAVMSGWVHGARRSA